MENGFDLDTVEQMLKGVKMQENLSKWAKLMNLKGVVLCNLSRYDEADKTFMSALKSDDPLLRSKILINFSKVNFLTKNVKRALELVNKVFEYSKQTKKFPDELLGYAHLLRGQIFNIAKDEKQALTEFRRAEYFFEVGANPLGVGLSCLEIARIHIKNQALNVAWNFLRKSELFLNKLGMEEKLGVYICKAVALYYSGKGPEAQALLNEVYDERSDMGKGMHTIDEIIDAYLDTRSRMLRYQKALI